MRTFLRYLRREGLIDDDPGALVATPKRDVRMPAHLSEDEMTALLDAPAGDTPLGAPRSRDPRAVLRVGLRLSELAGLDVDDVNLSAKMVRVLGKGGKERIVPFNGSTAKAIRAYLKDREALVRGQDGQDRQDRQDGREPRTSGPSARPAGPARAIRCS